MEEKKERKSWRDIVSSRNPDLDLEDDLAVGEFLDDSFKRYDDSESQRENLNKVLAEDSRAAGILTGLASGMDENGGPCLRSRSISCSAFSPPLSYYYM